MVLAPVSYHLGLFLIRIHVFLACEEIGKDSCVRSVIKYPDFVVLENFERI